MQPALNPRIGSEDYVFLSKWAVRNMYVQRGDIIALISPKDPNQKLIKRIVGLQGKFTKMRYEKPSIHRRKFHSRNRPELSGPFYFRGLLV